MQILPINIKGLAGSVATLANWFISFVITMTANLLLTWSTGGLSTYPLPSLHASHCQKRSFIGSHRYLFVFNSLWQRTRNILYFISCYLNWNFSTCNRYIYHLHDCQCIHGGICEYLGSWDKGENLGRNSEFLQMRESVRFFFLIKKMPIWLVHFVEILHNVRTDVKFFCLA